MQTLTTILGSFWDGFLLAAVVWLIAAILAIALFYCIAAINDRKFPRQDRPKMPVDEELPQILERMKEECKS
jgi:hypothetical protein